MIQLSFPVFANFVSAVRFYKGLGFPQRRQVDEKATPLICLQIDVDATDLQFTPLICLQIDVDATDMQFKKLTDQNFRMILEINNSITKSIHKRSTALERRVRKLLEGLN